MRLGFFELFQRSHQSLRLRLRLCTQGETLFPGCWTNLHYLVQMGYTSVIRSCLSREILEAKGYGILFPLDVTRALWASLIRAVAYIHSRGYVHGDIHLSNVMVNLPSSLDHLSIEGFYKDYKSETVTLTYNKGKEPLPPGVPEKAVVPLCLGKAANKFTLVDSNVVLEDFGEAFAVSEMRTGEKCHTPLAMRAPEARFEPNALLSYFCRYLEFSGDSLGDGRDEVSFQHRVGDGR
ncbi:hypothetical protein BJX70DRAFT_136591 [Aspergillus crustosus]